MNDKLLKKKMDNFIKRWHYESSTSPEEAFRKFRTSILESFQDIDSHITDYSAIQFRRILGIEAEYKGNIWMESYSCTIHQTLNKTLDPYEFYRIIELIFSLEFITQHFKESYYEDLLNIITLQNVPIRIVISKDMGLLLFKKGEKYLDEKVVDSTLSFLDIKTRYHFEEALKEYEKAKPENYIKSCEQLRRTIEEFLRFKLNNTKNLNANIQELQSRVKDKVDPQIRNMMFNLISYLNQFFDSNSKHQDGNINDSENEFLIYQVASFMLLVEKVLD